MVGIGMDWTEMNQEMSTNQGLFIWRRQEVYEFIIIQNLRRVGTIGIKSYMTRALINLK